MPAPAAVIGPYRPPDAPWGSGHRGIDLAAAPGAVARALASDAALQLQAEGKAGGLLTGISGDLRHAFRLLWKGRGMTATLTAGISLSRIIRLVLKFLRCAAPFTKVCWP